MAAEGIDLNAPLDGVMLAALREALLEGLVLCIRGQCLSPASYLAAMRGFGTPLRQTRAGTPHGAIDEIMILSSEDRDVLGDGERIVVGAHWHSDDSYKAVPCSLTMLYGVVVPDTGGETQSQPGWISRLTTLIAALVPGEAGHFGEEDLGSGLSRTTGGDRLERRQRTAGAAAPAARTSASRKRRYGTVAGAAYAPPV